MNPTLPPAVTYLGIWYLRNHATNSNGAITHIWV